MDCDKKSADITKMSIQAGTTWWFKQPLFPPKDFACNGFLAALFYIATSSSMAFLNKTVMTTYKFKFPFTIMAMQMIVSFLVLKFLQFREVIPHARITASSMRSLLAPSLWYGTHSTTALLAVDGLTLPMYTAMKRCTPLVIILLSVSFLRKPLPSSLVCISVVLITTGCIIAGAGDLSFEKQAYLFGTASVIAQALFLLFVQEAGENSNSASCILYYNSIITLPFFLVGIFITNEFSFIREYPGYKDLGFVFCIILQVLIGAVLNYSMFLCTTLTSALATSLTGVIKSFLQTFIGYFTFGGVQYHPLNILGIILNFNGGVLYAVAKYREKTKTKPETDVIKIAVNGNEIDCSCKECES